MPCIAESGGEVQIRVRVQPRASNDSVGGECSDRVQIRLTAPPADGAANTALRAFVARRLGIAKGAVSLTSGLRSRNKTLSVRGISAFAVRSRLFRNDRGKRK